MNQAEAVKRILTSTRTIAVVGLSANPDKDSHAIAAYLQAQDYRIIPVNPSAQEILGEKSYSELASIPESVDLVQIFRPSEEVPAIVDQAIQKGAKTVWMQTGIVHPEAAMKALNAGLYVMMDACMRVAHRTLIGPRK